MARAARLFARGRLAISHSQDGTRFAMTARDRSVVSNGHEVRCLMASYRVILSAAALSGLLVTAAVGCGGVDDSQGSDNAAAQTDALRSRKAFRTGARTSPAPSATATSSSSDPASIIAAARTPDGQAIPQSSGPGGQCPAVVQLLGFWSCVQIGDACTFQSNGVTHACACQRVDGEGQLPSWVCN